MCVTSGSVMPCWTAALSKKSNKYLTAAGSDRSTWRIVSKTSSTYCCSVHCINIHTTAPEHYILLLVSQSINQSVNQLNNKSTDISHHGQWRGERYDGTSSRTGVVSGTTVRALVPGRFGQKIENNIFERYGQRINKNISNYTWGWCSGPPMSAFGPLLLSWGRFLRSHWAVLLRVRRNVTLLSICPRVSCLQFSAFFSKKNGSTGLAAK